MKRLVRLLVVVACLGITVAAQAQEWHSLVFRVDAPGVDENPLKGFVPYSGGKEMANSFPHSMEWFYLPLSSVVTAKDTYDWTAVEKQLTAIAGRGHQAIFRFFVDYPKQSSGIPKYLLDAGLKTFPYEDSDNAKSATPSVSPDYSDPRLIECFVKFIHAFGAKYDGDARIAYLTVGLYGFWGEWHVHQHPTAGEPAGWVISQKDKDALLEAYVESFHKTQLEIRYAKVSESKALLAKFGFHDDSFLKDTTGSEKWQFWPQMVEAGTTQNWRTQSMGGEVYPQLEEKLWETWPNRAVQDVTEAIQTTHATWMLEAYMFKHEMTETERANALRAQRMMGYTFYCKEFRASQEKKTVSVRVENRGVAPIYYAWPVEVEVVKADGSVVGKGRAQWSLNTLLPGKTAEWSVTVDALPADAAAVLLRVANPMPGGRSVAFANAEMDGSREGWLTLKLR